MNIQTLRAIRYGAIALILIIAIVWLVAGRGGPQSDRASAGIEIAPFHLVDQNGVAVSERDIVGKPAAVFFGYTFCPDVCPTTLASLTGLMSKLGADSDKLRVFFVTVDPARDTPQVLKAYLSAFDPRIRGLTGSKEQIDFLGKPLGVYYERVGEGGSYTMDHTASVFLLDREGRFHGTIAVGEGADTALAKLRTLVR